ncbi:MAG: efflux RND transporter periplasmic adaptor subunit [bacterium]
MKAVKILLIIFMLMNTGCNKQKKDESTTEPIPVQTTIVYSTRTTNPIRAIGRLKSYQQIKLSFKTGGIINKINVQEGEKVKKGKILAELKMDEINARYQSAESALNKAERDFHRVENLYEDNAVTLSQSQDAKTALTVAQSNFEIAKFNLRNSKITAPENGYILKQLAETNEMIGSGHPVFVFGSDEEKWKIHTSVTDRDVVRIKAGDSAKVTIDSYPDHVFSAVIISIGNAPDPNNGNYEIELCIQKNECKFFNGLITRVTIFPSENKNCCLIPAASIMQGQGKKGYVFRMTAENTAEKIPIEIDHMKKDSVAVLKGLKPGDKIISRGAAYLKDGELVREMK